MSSVGHFGIYHVLTVYLYLSVNFCIYLEISFSSAEMPHEERMKTKSNKARAKEHFLFEK